ncbi:MAG TPA: HlyD family secretion protein [Thermodesulfobacteriota bacterium]|nr:HlyD family secretion protein [Thermodesulfobacteriota bacterium]
METAEQKTNRVGRKGRILFVFLVLAAAGVLTLVFYLRYTRTHISTDDAFIDGRVHTIAPKISGTVKALRVTDNQLVKEGELLLEIDPVDYIVRVDEAGASFSSESSKLEETKARILVTKSQLLELTRQVEAARINLEVQRKNLTQAEQDVKRSKANLEAQEARLRQSQWDIKRADDLLQKEAISREKQENAYTAWDVAVAQVKAAREQASQAESAQEAQSARVKQAEVEIKRVEAALETQKNVIRQTEIMVRSQDSLAKQKEASLRTAQLNRSYTEIYAPCAGYITRRTVEVGNQVSPGQPLMAVVPLEGIWITANYKETQLENVKPGQRVEIKVDTYPSVEFKGQVESIMAGTGSVFSIFPPENATGNYVKVVQRIPVKIVLEPGADPRHLLRIGMSVVPTILVD